MKYIVDVEGKLIEVELVRQEGQTWAIVGQKRVPVALHRHWGSHFHTLIYGHRAFTLHLRGQGTGYIIHWRGRACPVEVGLSAVQKRRRHPQKGAAVVIGEQIVTAHMPGLIVKLEVKEGQRVRKGDGLLVIDAMKMENEIRAPCEGILEKILVGVGREVSRGQILCVIRSDPSLGLTHG